MGSGKPDTESRGSGAQTARTSEQSILMSVRFQLASSTKPVLAWGQILVPSLKTAAFLSERRQELAFFLPPASSPLADQLYGC